MYCVRVHDIVIYPTSYLVAYSTILHHPQYYIILYPHYVSSLPTPPPHSLSSLPSPPPTLPLPPLLPLPLLTPLISSHSLSSLPSPPPTPLYSDPRHWTVLALLVVLTLVMVVVLISVACAKVRFLLW